MNRQTIGEQKQDFDQIFGGWDLQESAFDFL